VPDIIRDIRLSSELDKVSLLPDGFRSFYAMVITRSCDRKNPTTPHGA